MTYPQLKIKVHAIIKNVKARGIGGKVGGDVIQYYSPIRQLIAGTCEISRTDYAWHCVVNAGRLAIINNSRTVWYVCHSRGTYHTGKTL